MSLIVETGSASPVAESYCSVSDADARMSAMGEADWAALTTAQKETALRRATSYMVQAYRTRWVGVRTLPTQRLDWPRYNVMVDGWFIAADVVPVDIVNACADLAIKAATNALAPDLKRPVIRERVGPLETEYSVYSPQAIRYRAIDMALAPYLKGSPATASLVRS